MPGSGKESLVTLPPTTQMQLRLDNGPAAFIDHMCDATEQRRSLIVGHIVRWARRKGVEKHLMAIFNA